jgi:hypothetical protein
MRIYIGEGGDDLLFGRQLCALLELEIADCAGKCEIAVDTAKVDEATSGRNASFLSY